MVLLVPELCEAAVAVMVPYVAMVPKPATPTATTEVSVVESFLALLDDFTEVRLSSPFHGERYWLNDSRLWL